MADYDLATVTATLAQNMRPTIVRTFNATSILLRTLRMEKGEGKNHAWDVEGTGANAENFSDGADVSNYGIDTPNLAKLDWGLYRSNFKVTNLARSAAASSKSPADALRPIARQMVNSVRKLASTINAAGFAGAGAGTLIAGLSVGVDDNNIYAGIDRSSASYFRAKEFDPGVGTDPTIAQIRKDLADIKDICGEGPDLAFMPSAVWLKIAGLFDQTRNYNQEVTLQLAKGSVTLDASVQKIVIDGCAFIADKDATANKIYYLNSNYVYWAFLPAADEEMLPEPIAQVPMDDGYGSGALPLGINVYPLARAGAARKFTAEVQLQLVIEKPSACGVRHNVNGVS